MSARSSSLVEPALDIEGSALYASSSQWFADLLA